MSANLDKTVVEECFLLTAILTIVSKHDRAWEQVHSHCWDYMKQLLLDVLLALPWTHRVGSVEGLLLLADWLPDCAFDSRSTVGSSSGSFIEDGTAWSLVGQAVRHAYLLRLDRLSFRDKLIDESEEHLERKRIAWTCEPLLLNC
jgi:hypothetical protein